MLRSIWRLGEVSKNKGLGTLYHVWTRAGMLSTKSGAVGSSAEREDTFQALAPRRRNLVFQYCSLSFLFVLTFDQ